MLGLDLRAEPIVLTVPAIEKERYFSIQLIDAYTFNFDYIGSRATGNDGGSFLIAGPGWKGETPKGVKKVIRSETELVLAVYRTQLFNPGDLDNVKKVQAGYKAQPLSAFLGQPHPRPRRRSISSSRSRLRNEKTSLEFFNILNFVLQFCPTDPVRDGTHGALRQDRRRRGEDLRRQQALARNEDGHRAGHGRRLGGLRGPAETNRCGEGDLRRLFGTREYLKNNYLYRMAAAVLGIYGNSKLEAMYPVYARRFRRAEAGRRQPLHLALCAGPVAAGQRVLVADDV